MESAAHTTVTSPTFVRAVRREPDESNQAMYFKFMLPCILILYIYIYIYIYIHIYIQVCNLMSLYLVILFKQLYMFRRCRSAIFMEPKVS
jgi:hypothetical protein